MSEEIKNPWLDTYGKMISLMGVAFLVIGVIKGVVYYQLFDIWILDYISLGEALLMSIDYSLLIFLAWIIGYYFGTIKEDRGQGDFSYDRLLEDYSRQIKRLNTPLNYILDSIIVYCIIWFTFEKNELWKYIHITIAVELMIFNSLELFSRFTFYRDILSEGKISNIYAVILLPLFFCFIILDYSIFKALGNKIPKQTTHVLLVEKDNKFYRSSDSVVYVGKVDKFFFFYNTTYKHPEVISSEQVTAIYWQDHTSIECERKLQDSIPVQMKLKH